MNGLNWKNEQPVGINKKLKIDRANCVDCSPYAIHRDFLQTREATRQDTARQ
jgi:hypothetical protein